MQKLNSQTTSGLRVCVCVLCRLHVFTCVAVCSVLLVRLKSDNYYNYYYNYLCLLYTLQGANYTDLSLSLSLSLSVSLPLSLSLTLSLCLSPSIYISLSLSLQIGRAHVCTPVTLAS